MNVLEAKITQSDFLQGHTREVITIIDHQHRETWFPLWRLHETRILVAKDEMLVALVIGIGCNFELWELLKLYYSILVLSV